MNKKSPLQKSTLKGKLRLTPTSITLLVLISVKAMAQTETLVQDVEAEKVVLDGVSVASSVSGYS